LQPLWFQAIKNVNAEKSGIMSIPLIGGLVVASILSGAMIKRTGYYAPNMIATSILTSIGAGLLTTLTMTSNHSKWIGYQIIFGFGLGVGMQQSTTACRTVLERKDVPIAMSGIFFAQTLGGAVFLAIGQTIFTGTLVSGVKNIQGLDPVVIVHAGATELRKYVPTDLLEAVLTTYNRAVINTFYIAVVLGCLSLIGSCLVEWRNIKHAEEKPPQVKKGADQA
jgi:MFS family permease